MGSNPTSSAKVLFTKIRKRCSSIKRKISAIFGLCVILICFTGCKINFTSAVNEVTSQKETVASNSAVNEVTYQKGTVTSNSFESEYLDLRFTLPQGFIMATEQEINDLMDIGADAMGIDGKTVDFAKLITVYEVTLVSGNLLFPGVALDWPAEILNALALAWAAAGLAILLSVVVPADMLPAAVSFVFIFAAVFGGAVFDMREVVEAAAPAAYLFPNYYYVNGNWLALLGIGTVCGGLAVTANRRFYHN